ncbi:uncharacterized protein LOC123508266 isoform X1 [Portunus trituberculatus]|uniref:uncharacterized protein LOC123508266 isoform X1 n=1 Tax=Portunus trituberculatus TaxID=210409 RepID=UPI001E1CC0DB|nr:uncharacterized protein LOC123508266 isoform X1 [Portunus trituberculatus]
MTFDILLNPSSVVQPLRPVWIFLLQLSIPLGDTEIEAYEFAFTVLFSFRIQIQLYEVFNPTRRRRKKRRSIQQDQRELLGQIEESMVAAGMDGHACVLRFICEMQANKFSHSSIFGEVLNLIFTPKPGGDASVLQDYIEAEMAGQSMQEATLRDPSVTQTLQPPTCAQQYSSCPVSMFAALRRMHARTDSGHSTREDRPHSFATNAAGG